MGHQYSRELKTAWVISILFHIIVAVMMLFTYLQGVLPQPDVVEVQWGGMSSSFGPMPPLGKEAPPPTEQGRGAAEPVEQTVELPTARNASVPEIVNSPAQKKLSPLEAPSPNNGGTKGISIGQREPASPTNIPVVKENAVGKPGMPAGSDIAAPFNAGGVGNSIASNVNYDIQWSGGGQRNLAAGDLPKYPAGVKVGAQIKLRIVVLPSGAVKSVQPLQKGNTRLENAAIKEVRLWMFEPLSSSDPQVEQRCVVTFNFRLR
ncbi:MAG: hypothetical protein KGJ59_08580 [Bacteroidota bacterium]|nr:hypothetical protein [Bacteroidota bacterium]